MFLLVQLVENYLGAERSIYDHKPLVEKLHENAIAVACTESS